MTAADTAKAIELIDRELESAGVPEAIAVSLAPSVLGALMGRFHFIPNPLVGDDAATRAELAALEIPGLFTAKGRA